MVQVVGAKRRPATSRIPQSDRRETHGLCDKCHDVQKEGQRIDAAENHRNQPDGNQPPQEAAHAPAAPHHLAIMISPVVSVVVMRLVSVSRSRSAPMLPAARTATPSSIRIPMTTFIMQPNVEISADLAPVVRTWPMAIPIQSKTPSYQRDSCAVDDGHIKENHDGNEARADEQSKKHAADDAETQTSLHHSSFRTSAERRRVAADPTSEPNDARLSRDDGRLPERDRAQPQDRPRDRADGDDAVEDGVPFEHIGNDGIQRAVCGDSFGDGVDAEHWITGVKPLENSCPVNATPIQ